MSDQKEHHVFCLGSWKNIDDNNDRVGGGNSTQIAKEDLARHLSTLTQANDLMALLGAGASMGKGGGPSMKQLWEEAKGIEGFLEIASLVGAEHTKYDLEDYLSRAKMYCQLPLDKSWEIESLIGDVEQLIAKECSSFIDKGFDLSAHEDFLRRVAVRPAHKPRFKLFTTNYDLCIETAASNLQCTMLDGFSFSWKRTFAPAMFNYSIMEKRDQHEAAEPIEKLFHLYKLHGSLNWTIEDNIPVSLGKIADSPLLIYPARSKFQLAFQQPYLEMVSHYLAALRSPAITCIVVGYSFGDEHLNAPILSALKSNPRFNLVVVSPDVEDAFEDEKGARRSDIHDALIRLSKQGDRRLTLFNGTFGDFTAYLPDLMPEREWERPIVTTVAEVNNG